MVKRSLHFGRLLRRKPKGGPGYAPKQGVGVGRSSLVIAALTGGLGVALVDDLAGPVVRDAYAAMAVLDSSNLAKNAETSVSTAKTLAETVKLVQTAAEHLGMFEEFARSFGGVPGAQGGQTSPGGLLSAADRLLSADGAGLMTSVGTLQSYAPAPERELDDLPWLSPPAGPGGAAPGANPNASVPVDLQDLAGGLRELQSLVQTARTVAAQQPGSFGFSNTNATVDVLNRVFRQPGQSNVARLEADRVALNYTDRAAQEAIAIAWSQRETAAAMTQTHTELSSAARRAAGENGDLREQIRVLTAVMLVSVAEQAQLRALVAAQVELEGWARVSSMPTAFTGGPAAAGPSGGAGTSEDGGVFR